MIALFCAFCDEIAVYTYRARGQGLGFCRWHMMIFYLGLDLEWRD